MEFSEILDKTNLSKNMLLGYSSSISHILPFNASKFSEAFGLHLKQAINFLRPDRQTR